MVKASIKKEFQCGIAQIWEVVTNNKDYQWRSDLSKIVIVDENHFIEYTKKNYPTYFEITKKEDLKEYRFRLENTNMKGEWIGKFKVLQEGVVELEFTEELEVENPIMKLLAKPYLKSQQKRYMRDLEEKLN